MPQVISVLSSKGGSGKSAAAVNLACALAGGKRRVVLVDADPQATASQHGAKGLLPVRVITLPLADGGSLQPWLRRLTAIEADALVVDSPPHNNRVTAALAGLSDLVIVPCGPSVADIWAAGQTVELLTEARTMRSDGGPAVMLLPSRVDIRTTAGRELADALREFGAPVGPIIRQRVEFSGCLAPGQWVGDYAPGSDAHQDVQELARAVRKVIDSKR